MNVAADHRYLESLLAGQGQIPSSPLGWLNRLRSEAVERVGTLSVPTTRDEEWRFTDISPLTRISFQPCRQEPKCSMSRLEPYIVPDCAARLVFVDGVYAPRLSFNDARIAVINLTAASGDAAQALERQLAQHVDFRNNAFAALNTAFLHDGTLIVAPRGTVVERPIQILHVVARSEIVVYPRCLLVAGEGSALMLLEDHVGLTDGAYFTNAVSELVLGNDASVRHVRVQRENNDAFHVANCAAELARGSRYNAVNVAVGARISRHNLAVKLMGEGAECVIDGLAHIGGRQLGDTHTHVEHALPRGTSRQLHKCIVDESAHAVFSGKIQVSAGAQLTDSSQSSRNLLLSGRARIDTKPQLEIFADDVKCAHGATVGQLDDEAVFYLRSRGLSENAARDLLTYAFGAEIIDRIPVAALRQQLERALATRAGKMEPR